MFVSLHAPLHLNESQSIGLVSHEYVSSFPLYLSLICLVSKISFTQCAYVYVSVNESKVKTWLQLSPWTKLPFIIIVSVLPKELLRAKERGDY